MVGALFLIPDSDLAGHSGEDGFVDLGVDIGWGGEVFLCLAFAFERAADLGMHAEPFTDTAVAEKVVLTPFPQLV